jgi:hypothetical protein
LIKTEDTSVVIYIPQPLTNITYRHYKDSRSDSNCDCNVIQR